MGHVLFDRIELLRFQLMPSTQSSSGFALFGLSVGGRLYTYAAPGLEPPKTSFLLGTHRHTEDSDNRTVFRELIHKPSLR